MCDCRTLFERITAHPDTEESLNKKWRQLSEAIVTTYKERPIVIHDAEVQKILLNHVKDLNRSDEGILSNEWIDTARREMARRIVSHELKYDLITLQEADYLEVSLFPEMYGVYFASNSHSLNGVAWNQNRFEFVEEVGNVLGRGLIVLLRDIDSGKTVLVASGHLTGCNPFTVENGDFAKGDRELQAILDLMESAEADIKVIGMDSNVTATHPRLALLKNAGFTVDCEKYLEPTCSNPWQVLDARVDWIAAKSAVVSNIPVKGIGLNSPQTDMSDHKPIAARVFTICSNPAQFSFEN